LSRSITAWRFDAKQKPLERGAAETSAKAQLEAARIAAEAAKFRPVGVTTRYGTSNFQFDPSGYLSGAGYTVSPELQAYQDRLQGSYRKRIRSSRGR
jgi:hypothetical protein